MVLPYIQADPVLCKRLDDVCTAAVMPLGAPIGTNKGLTTREMLRIIIDQTNVPVGVDAGLGAPSHAAEAMEMGADAVLVVMPYYSRPSQDGIVGHYMAVDESAEKPIIVYDVPGRTGLKGKVGTYDRLAELEHVKAVKDATGDLAAAVE